MAAHRTPFASAALVIALACSAPAAGEAAQEEGAIDLTPLREHKSVLVRTRDDRWIEGKPTGVLADTLILEQGRRKGTRLVRVSSADIDRVWTSRPAPARKALILGVGGFVGGALLEIGLGSDCPDCALDAGHVLGQAAVEGAVDGAFGALLGLFGGRMHQLVPAVAEGDGAEPFPLWGGSFALGSARLTGDHFTSGNLQVAARSTAWILRSPNGGGWGMEYGTLTGNEETSRGPIYAGFDSTLVPTGNNGEFSVRDRWGYATFQWRWHGRRQKVQPEITFGLGSYIERVSVTLVVRDSLGALVSERHSVSTDGAFGLNLGTGLSLGQGPLHPGMDVRVHWAIDPANVWYTLALKADWH